MAGALLYLCSNARAEERVSKHAGVFDPATISLPSADPVYQARLALTAGTPQRAAALLTDVSTVSDNPLAQGRWYWLLAQAALAQGEWSKASHWFRTLADTHHPLSTHARLEYAKILINGDPLTAALIASQLRGIHPGGYEAKVLEVKAVAKTGAMQEAIARADALLKEIAPASAGASFLMPLSDMLAAQADPALKKAALSYYRRVASRIPLHPVGLDAMKKANTLLLALPRDERASLGVWATQDRLAHGQALFAAREYEKAETMFKELASRLTGPEQCEARFMQARSMLQRKARAEGGPLMARVSRECKSSMVRPRALFLAADAYANLDDHRQARILYARLEREFPTHRLADDARYRTALLLRADKKESHAQQLLLSLPRRYPDGDMEHEARFMLAWQAYTQRRYPLAKNHLEKLVVLPRKPSEEGLHGQDEYWLARVFERLHQCDVAITHYVALFHRWPLTYYAQLAWARIYMLDPQRAGKLIASLAPTHEPRLQFAWRSWLDTDDFERLLEWYRVGEYGHVAEEISAFFARDPAPDRESVWLFAALLNHVGRHPQAIQLLRSHMKDLWRRAPIGQELARWKVAYPRAYQPLIDKEAAKQGVPSSLVRAIAREESSFDPGAVSAARAYGLIQLIPPTAKTHAAPLNMPYDPASLKKPEINLPIGIHFLRFLWDKYHGKVALLPAAYNAGEAAVDRWLTERGTQPIDEWIENIPYSQTRRYSRRVLQTYGIYHWLDTQRLPALFPPAHALSNAH